MDLSVCVHVCVICQRKCGVDQGGASLISQLVKNPPAMQETPVQLLGREYKLERDRLPTPVFLGFPYDSADKESACNARHLDLIPGLGRSPRGGEATHSNILAWRIPWTV